ncbi:MAG TPA: helix-turn-helix domain-containing protein, partial [Kofleriaceae bacterium]|nr:helix-turn-helix domain-containing protein [Kofleriaceae bacterium]
VLERQPWPGNIRELRNLIERSVQLHDTRVLLPEHLALGRASPPGPAAADMDLRSSRQEHEQARIVDALQATGGNQTKAAKLLGIGRRTLITKMELYGLDRPRKR